MTAPLRFRDDLSPKPVGQADTYAAAPAGTVRRVALSLDGTVLGWVWTDGQSAAGWTYKVTTPAAVKASAYVWRVCSRAYGRGEPAAVVLEPGRYEPLYVVGDSPA